MSGIGYAALSLATLAVLLMLHNAAIGECWLLTTVAVVLAVLELATQVQHVRTALTDQARTR